MVKDEMILPPRVIGEIKGVNPSWVSLKVKRTGDLFELPWFSKANLPHLHIRGKATGSNKPYEKEKNISALRPYSLLPLMRQLIFLWLFVLQRGFHQRKDINITFV